MARKKKTIYRSRWTHDHFGTRPFTALARLTANYNIGAIFRLCDAFLVQQLVICGTPASNPFRTPPEKMRRVPARSAANPCEWP